MRSVDINVLKDKLSEYLRLAESGETVLVIDRGRAVAEIVPPLAEAVRNGWFTPPAVPGRTVPPRKPVTTFRKLMQELQRDREDR